MAENSKVDVYDPCTRIYLAKAEIDNTMKYNIISLGIALHLSETGAVIQSVKELIILMSKNRTIIFKSKLKAKLLLLSKKRTNIFINFEFLVSDKLEAQEMIFGECHRNDLHNVHFSQY